MTNSAPGTPPSKLKDRDVLVVEDEELIASVIEEMLRELGCRQVWIASTAKDASNLLAQHRPHIVVLDVNLRGDSGFLFAQALAEADIPFVFASGYGRAALPGEWASRPLIQKPFKLEALAAALSSLL
ncbi:MAG TPA: response regulator [Stellaceae bacterium]|nr:response regulator [Stellaceae bacterium]